MSAEANRPCAFSGGWIVSDKAGGVIALSVAGKVLWQNSFSNQLFDAGVAVSSDLAIVASQDGHVFALDVDTGRTVWTSVTIGRFQHAPVIGKIGDDAFLWLVSQADGQLFCLRCRDGKLMWQSDATNRCDGAPAVWQRCVAYGNCDGAVYVVDAVNGRVKGAVTVGGEDQMAGGMLAMAEGRLVAGTRQGNLAVVNAERLALEALVRVSDEELFVTPVLASADVVATGTHDGDVVFCRVAFGDVRMVGRVALGAAVDQLEALDGVLYVLSGGSVCRLTAADGPVTRVAVGDEAHGLAAGPGGTVACVADQAVVCVTEGPQ